MGNLMERVIIAEAYDKEGLEGCINELVPTEKEALKMHKKELKGKERKVNKLGFKATYVASVLRVLIGVMAYAECCENKEKLSEVVDKIEELTKELRDAIKEA